MVHVPSVDLSTEEQAKLRFLAARHFRNLENHCFVDFFGDDDDDDDDDIVWPCLMSAIRLLYVVICI